MQVNPKSLVFYLPSLASGGAERAQLTLAAAFIKAGYGVTFLLQRAEGSLLEAVPEGARVVSLEASRTLTSLMPLVRFLRRERPAIVLAALGHNNMLALAAAALARVGTRIVVSQHGSLFPPEKMHRWQYRILPLLYRLFLNRAHGIVCVSQGVADEVARATGISRDRLTVIYNPIITDDFSKRMQEPVGHPWLEDKKSAVLLAVGRLDEAKDFETLISAFALIARERDARLIILGEGPLHGKLLAHAQTLRIDDLIDLHGFVSNPLPFMRAANLLVLSSRYEGFGNVLVEAMACGTPVVSTDCPPYGPSEILERGALGRLVPPGAVEAMAQAILATLDKPADTEQLRRRGQEFTSERSAAHYKELFENGLASA